MLKRSMHVLLILKQHYDRIPRDKLWAVLLQYGYGIGGQLLTVIKSLHIHSKVCVRVNSATTKPVWAGAY